MLKKENGDSKVLLIVFMGLLVLILYVASEAISAKREQAEKVLRLKLVITENRINMSRLTEIAALNKKPAKVQLRVKQLSSFAGEAEEYCEKYDNLQNSWEATKEQFVKYGVLKQTPAEETAVDAKQADDLIVLYNGFTGMISSVDSSEYGIAW